MTWFAVYEIATGRLLSVGTVVSDPLRPGLAKKELADRPPDDKEWDPVALQFVKKPVPPPDTRRKDILAKETNAWTMRDTGNALKLLVEKLIPENSDG